MHFQWHFWKLFIQTHVFIHIQRKRDCTIAVPLIEALALPFVPNSNTVAHAVCISYKGTQYAHAMYIHTRGHLSVAMFWNDEFARFRLAKTKRVRRLFQYSVFTPIPKDIYPRRELNTAKLLFCAAKLHKKNDIRKRYVIFLCFFSVFSRWMLNHPLAKSNLWMEFYCFNTGIQASIAGVYDHTETPYCQQGYTNRANRLFVHNPCLLRRLLSCIFHLL